MNISYEHQFQELQKKIDSLSKGDLPLDKAFAEYDQSRSLLQACQQYLLDIEEKLNGLEPSEASIEISLEELLDKLALSIQLFEQTESLEEAVDYYAMSIDLIYQSQQRLQKYEQEIFQISTRDQLIVETSRRGTNHV